MSRLARSSSTSGATAERISFWCQLHGPNESCLFLSSSAFSSLLLVPIHRHRFTPFIPPCLREPTFSPRPIRSMSICKFAISRLSSSIISQLGPSPRGADGGGLDGAESSSSRTKLRLEMLPRCRPCPFPWACGPRRGSGVGAVVLIVESGSVVAGRMRAVLAAEAG